MFAKTTLLIKFLRFGKTFLEKDLYAWIFEDAIRFATPAHFQPPRGGQRFLNVGEEMWSCVVPKPSNEKTPTSIITLGQQETQQILRGEQSFLLRSQRVTHQGRVYLSVKSLGFQIPGSVQFGKGQQFTCQREFRMWEGFNRCNFLDTLEGSTMMNRLRSGKAVFAVELLMPEYSKEPLEWCSPVSWFVKNMVFNVLLYTQNIYALILSFIRFFFSSFGDRR